MDTLLAHRLLADPRPAAMAADTAEPGRLAVALTYVLGVAVGAFLAIAL